MSSWWTPPTSSKPRWPWCSSAPRRWTRATPRLVRKRASGCAWVCSAPPTRCNQLLALARSGADSLELSKAHHDLVDLVRERIALSSGLAVQRRIELELVSPEHLEMWLNRESMGSLVDNLVDNAIKYSPDGGHVTVSLGEEGEALVLRVSDQGPGIPVELRERVFERFVRLDGSRCHGSGLGLTIVERAAGQHGAEVQLLDGPDGVGLMVAVRFPQGLGG